MDQLTDGENSGVLVFGVRKDKTSAHRKKSLSSVHSLSEAIANFRIITADASLIVLYTPTTAQAIDLMSIMIQGAVFDTAFARPLEDYPEYAPMWQRIVAEQKPFLDLSDAQIRKEWQFDMELAKAFP